MTSHVMKAVSPHFEDVWDGRKTFEIRVDDRGIDTHDWLHLVEWGGPEKVGRCVTVKCTHLMRGPIFGLAAGWILLSLDQASIIRSQQPEPWMLERLYADPVRR